MAVPADAATVAAPAASSTPSYYPPTTATTTYWTYVNYDQTNGIFCLGIDSSGNAGIWGCTSKNDQAWKYSGRTISADGYTFYQLENQDGKCLGVSGGGTTNGTQVVGYTCEPTSHPDQYWAYLNEECGAQYFPLVNADGVVIGVKGADMKVGQPVIAYEYQNVCNNQFWTSSPDA
jgi:hypothetical protein